MTMSDNYAVYDGSRYMIDGVCVEHESRGSSLYVRVVDNHGNEYAALTPVLSERLQRSLPKRGPLRKVALKSAYVADETAFKHAPHGLVRIG